MSLTVVIPHPIENMTFRYDGTEQSVDDLNDYLSADGGLVQARYVDVDTYEVYNAPYFLTWYAHTTTEILLMEKVNSFGAKIIAFLVNEAELDMNWEAV